MSFKTRLEKIKEDEKLAGIMPDSQGADRTIAPEDLADEILMSSHYAVVEGGVFYDSPEEKAAEADINKAFKAILNGGNDFATLREACDRWQLVATSKPMILKN